MSLSEGYKGISHVEIWERKYSVGIEVNVYMGHSENSKETNCD